MQVKELRSALKKVAPFVYKGATLPVLRCVRLHTEDEVTWLQATDLQTLVEVPILSTNGPLEPIVVPLRDLDDIAKGLDVKDVNLSNGNEDEEGIPPKLVIKGDGVMASVEGMPDPEFPLFSPKPTTSSFYLHGELLEEIARRVAPCASPEEAVLTSVCVEAHKDEMIAVAADGFKMAWLEEAIGARYEPQGVETILFPAKVLKPIAALPPRLDQMIGVEIIHEDKKPHMVRLSFETGEVATVMLVEGTFPDWRQIIPKPGCNDCENGCPKCHSGVVVNRKDLEKGLRALSAVTKKMKDEARIKVDIRHNMRLATKHEGTVMVKEIPRLTKSGHPALFCVSPNHLKPLLQCAAVDKVGIEYKPISAGETGFLSEPLTIRPFNGDGWRAILMPMGGYRWESL